MAKSLEDAELQRAIFDALCRHTVLTLAVMSQSRPHAVSLMYAHDDLDVYWLSDPKSRHSTALVSTPSAAVTIAEQSTDFRKVKGLQIEGNARRLTNAEEKSVGFDLLVSRYPFLKDFALGKLARHLGAAAVYRLRSASVTLIDNSRGFGFKQTWKRRLEASVPGDQTRD